MIFAWLLNFCYKILFHSYSSSRLFHDFVLFLQRKKRTPIHVDLLIFFCFSTQKELVQKNRFSDPHCGNLEILLPQFFHKKFAKVTCLTKEVTKELISRNFCRKSIRVNFRGFNTVFAAHYGKTRNSLPCNFFPSNQFVVKFFSKTLIWRNFCEKTVAMKFRNFHSV